MPHQRSNIYSRNNSIAGSGVYVRSTPAAAWLYNIAAARKGVFCWVRPEGISRGPTGHRPTEAEGSLQLAAGRQTRRRSSQRVAMMEAWEAEDTCGIDASQRGQSSWTRNLKNLWSGSRYQTTSDDTADCEDLALAVVNCRLCKLATALGLLVATIFKSLINPITHLNPIYSHLSHGSIVNTIEEQE
jgi:hypothetical protein